MTDTIGYSETPLAQKLGFMSGDTVFVETTPGWYSEFAERASVELVPGLPATHAHIFFESKADLAEFLKDNKLDGIQKSFWVSWPKQSSGRKADITEQNFRDLILPLGWVDTKVAAIDDTWSGLKFLRRKS